MDDAPTLHGEPLLFDLARYEATLAPWAERPSASRGRPVPEPTDGRTPHQRDRDRIVHATAFRRLRHKTQVFVAHEGDHYRTRLTHTLEVAQIARSIARALRLNEDLAEAVALAHDLGHPPFGHAGEAALDERMRDHGGFDHNVQSLRVVTTLERRYLGRDGLNLTFETLEGLAKHNGPSDAPHPVVAALLAAPGLPAAMAPGRHASLEAQVAALADDIAYNAHDIDDGLRAGLFGFAELHDLPRMRPLLDGLDPDHRRSVYELMRRQITMMIGDVTREAVARLTALAPRGPDDVRAADRATIAFSGAGRAYDAELRAFLTARVYRHPDVAAVAGRARATLDALFDALAARPDLMPAEWREGYAAAGEGGRARTVADYVAGMTDTYAQEAHGRLRGV